MTPIVATPLLFDLDQNSSLSINRLKSDVISKAVKEAGMFVLTFSRQQSTGRSLLLLFILSFLRIQTTAHGFLESLSSDERLITICLPDYGRLYDQMVRNNKFSSELVKPLIVKIHFRYMNTISVWLGSLDWNQEHRPNNRRSRCLTTTKTLALMLQSWKPIIRCASLSINRLAYKQLWNYNNASCITRPTHQLQLETVCIYPSSTIFFCL